MKATFTTILFSVFFVLTTLAQERGSSLFTSIDERNCQRSQQGWANCHGPDGVLLKISKGEWTNLDIQYQGKLHETWTDLVDVGSFTGLGGDNQVVEWKLDQQKVKSLIIRVRAIDVNNNNRPKSELLVFGFTSIGVCLRGKSQYNDVASQIAMAGQCGHYLKSKSLASASSAQKNFEQSAVSQSRRGQDEMSSMTKSVYLTDVSMFQSKVLVNGVEHTPELDDETKLAIGYFDIAITYCARTKVNANFQTSGPTTSRNVVLGGSRSTYKTTPATLTYLASIPKNTANTEPCYKNTVIQKFRCDIQPGFRGAGCNYKVNNDKTIAIESFRNDSTGVLLLD